MSLIEFGNCSGLLVTTGEIPQSHLQYIIQPLFTLEGFLVTAKLIVLMLIILPFLSVGTFSDLTF